MLVTDILLCIDIFLGLLTGRLLRNESGSLQDHHASIYSTEECNPTCTTKQRSMKHTHTDNDVGHDLFRMNGHEEKSTCIMKQEMALLILT